MSRNLFKVGKIMVSRYCGPARDDQMSRMRYQFGFTSDQDGKTHTTSLNVHELIELSNKLADLAINRDWAR